MEFVILDLEWNNGFCKKTQSNFNEIIEFGAVRLDENMTITDRFSILVKPDITKHIAPMVQKLTSITDEELQKGVPFTYALSKFKKFMNDAVLMSWSTSDIKTLEANCEYYFKSERITFLKYYVDLQSYCHDMLGLTEDDSLSLISAAEQLNINTYGINHHRAIEDCMLAAECLKKLYLRQAILCYIKKADNDFYERMNFHGNYISGSDNPLVDLKGIFFNCDLCGSRCKRIKKWESKNKAFYSVFKCPECGNHFKGKLTLKKKYDCIVRTKHIVSRDISV